MAVIDTDYVIKNNRLPKSTQDIQVHLDIAQNIIDERLGDDFTIATIKEALKSYYPQAISTMTFVLMLELPNSDFLYNENARIESEYVSEENEKNKILERLNSRINYYINKLLAEMEEDGTPTDEVDQVKTIGNTVLAVIGGDPQYFEENKAKYSDGEYNEGDNNE